jgi:hypothetical protein
MARCEKGYDCDVCGREVEHIVESELYLRYVLGEVPLEQLHLGAERHIRCNPAMGQFIVDPAFEPVVCEGAFDKRHLDPFDVTAQEERVTRAWRRLQQLPGSGVPIADYPLSRGPSSGRG